MFLFKLLKDKAKDTDYFYIIMGIFAGGGASLISALFYMIYTLVEIMFIKVSILVFIGMIIMGGTIFIIYNIALLVLKLIYDYNSKKEKYEQEILKGI